MNYIIHENSEDISLYFYRLSRPQETGVHSMYPIFIHPEDGRFAFGYNIDEPILVHHDLQGVDADDLTDAIGLNRGQTIAFNNKIQSTIKNQNGAEPLSGYVLGRFPSSGIMHQVGSVKTESFMINDGWFPIEEI